MSGATGAVITRHDGSFLKAGGTWICSAANALNMEAMALRDGVLLALQGNFSKVLMETDSVTLMKFWREDKDGRSDIGPLLLEVRERSKIFSEFDLRLVNREANSAAHLCAHEVYSRKQRCLWLVTTPSFLLPCIEQDCNLMLS